VSNRLRMTLLAALALGMISMIISSDGSRFIPFLPSTEIQQQEEVIRVPYQDRLDRIEQSTEEVMTLVNQMTFEVMTNHGHSRKEICEHLLDLLGSMDGDQSANIEFRFMGIEQECADVLRRYQETR